MTKTAIDLAREVLELAEKASPAPWSRRVSEQSSVIRIEHPSALEGFNSIVGYATPGTIRSIADRVFPDEHNAFNDAAFIAFSRNHAPAIAAQLLSVQERLAKACELLRAIQQCQERGDGLWDIAGFHDDCPYASDFLRKAMADIEAFLTEQSQ